MVNAPAKTGKDNKSKNDVIRILQTNKGNLCIVIPLGLIFKIVTIKFIAPIILAAPAKCKLKIAMYTDGPECAMLPLKGG